MKFLEVIDEITKKIAPGLLPSFTPVHIFTFIRVVGSREPIGRAKLSLVLQLGEGATRTLIKRLQREGVIESTKFGCVLTDFGKEIFSDLNSRISEDLELPPSSYSVSRFNIAILVKGAAKVIGQGVEQRDAALKAGASGATTLVYTKGKLTMPGLKKSFSEHSPEIHDILMTKLRPDEGDSIVIGSANDKKIAEFGAKAAALETLRKLSDKAHTNP
ncbi:MAG: hypothetical protein H3Z50_03285 [archaeon]|nr:hypothetical protein [archaeon]MCP8306883.1 hypothetical protein [archaeon]